MSIQAMAWAIEQQEVREPETQLVLLSLANYALADGSNAFPGVERLARDSRLSARSVQRHLRKLEKLILIRRGNQAVAAAHIQRADRRPVVYDLIMARGVTQTPRVSTGCHGEPHGVTAVVPRGDSQSPDPSLKSEETLKKGTIVTREGKEEFKARLRAQALASTLAQSKKVPR